MSKNLTAAEINQFDAEVKQAYQGSGMLRGTVRVRTGVVGRTHRFPKMGKGIATARVPQAEVVVMDIAHTNAIATLEDWNAAEYTDIFDAAHTNIDERGELAEVIAAAIGRREDQLIYDAMEAASTTLTVAASIGGAASGLNVAKLQRTGFLLDDQGVPGADRTFLGSVKGKEQLLGETEATSSDFASVKALVSGDITSFYGFTFKWMESRDEGGLTIAANQRTNFGYHKKSMGLAVGIDFRTEVNYIPTRTSWLANGLFSAGSVGIDAFGLVDVTTDEA